MSKSVANISNLFILFLFYKHQCISTHSSVAAVTSKINAEFMASFKIKGSNLMPSADRLTDYDNIRCLYSSGSTIIEVKHGLRAMTA